MVAKAYVQGFLIVISDAGSFLLNSNSKHQKVLFKGIYSIGLGEMEDEGGLVREKARERKQQQNEIRQMEDKQQQKTEGKTISPLHFYSSSLYYCATAAVWKLHIQFAMNCKLQ